MKNYAVYSEPRGCDSALRNWISRFSLMFWSSPFTHFDNQARSVMVLTPWLDYALEHERTPGEVAVMPVNEQGEDGGVGHSPIFRSISAQISTT
jgi:hypothetical protein